MKEREKERERERSESKGITGLNNLNADLRWFEHLKRMIDNRVPKNKYEWMPKGWRKMGIPKLTWTQNIA